MQIDSKLPKLEAKIGCVVEDIRPQGINNPLRGGKAGRFGRGCARERAFLSSGHFPPLNL